MLGLNYFIPLISFLGLIFGIILSKIAHEEIKDGINYFEWFKRVVLILLMIILVLNLKFSLNFVMFLIIGVVFGYLIGLIFKTYFYLGLSCVLSFLFFKNLFFLTNVLVFLFGLPAGSLLKRYKFREVYKNFILFIIPFLGLIFILGNLDINIINFLIGLCIGGFSKDLIKRKFISF